MNKSRVAADRILLRHGASILYVVVVLLVGVSLVRLPSFRAPGNLSNLVLRSVPLMAVSLAQTVVLITGGIDLSVGAVLALTTTIASVTMQHNIFLGIIVSLLISAAVGLFNGLAVAKLKINPFLVTLSTTIIVNGIALFVRPYPGGFIPPVYVSSVMRSVGVVPVVPLLLFLSLVVCAGIVFQKTVFGRHLYAVGGNRDASRLAGIHTDGVTVGAYVLSSLFAALGGLYMTARISCGDPSVGAPFQMESITAAVIGGAALTGGRGTAVGTMFGVILVVMLGNIFNLVDIDIYWQQVIRGLILLGVVGFSQFSMRRRDQLKQKKIAA